MRVPILTWHALNVLDNSYRGNEHLAFASDLETLHRLGRRIVPLATVVRWQRGEFGDNAVRDAVALTFDDGTDFDFHDLDHPTCGRQRSMLNILRDFRERHGADAQPCLHASSFVFASPEARRELDRKGMIGQDWWRDDWWPDAEASGLLGIECHSWDHVHPALDRVASGDETREAFHHVTTDEACEIQVRQASAWIRRRCGNGTAPRFFAYPYGQCNDWLVDEWFPREGPGCGLQAAFAAEPRPVGREDSRWKLPRFVMNRDWSSPEELVTLLRNEG